MRRTFRTWHLVNQECLPFFGNDLQRIIWEVDVMQLVAVFHALMGVAGDSVAKRLREKYEQELVAEKLKDFGK